MIVSGYKTAIYVIDKNKLVYSTDLIKSNIILFKWQYQKAKLNLLYQVLKFAANVFYVLNSI